jgi:hypothetical protein
MKILAAHSLRGDIEHLIVLPTDGPPASVGTAQGHLVSEVEGLDVHLDPAKPEGLEKLVETIRSYRVELKGRGHLRKA